MFKTWIHVLSVGNLVGEDTSRRRKEPTCSQACMVHQSLSVDTSDSKPSVPWYSLTLTDLDKSFKRSRSSHTWQLHRHLAFEVAQLWPFVGAPVQWQQPLGQQTQQLFLH